MVTDEVSSINLDDHVLIEVTGGHGYATTELSLRFLQTFLGREVFQELVKLVLQEAGIAVEIIRVSESTSSQGIRTK
jgi:hypothetical protein